MIADRLMTALLSFAVIIGAPAVYAHPSAQSPRAGDPAAQQEPATVETAAPEPGDEPEEGFVDRVEDAAEEFAEKTRIVERLSGEVDGWYPRLGGMTRGSGFAIGPGYRVHFARGRLFADLSAGVSTKGYKAADVNVRWLQAFEHAGPPPRGFCAVGCSRVELWTDFRYEDFPQEDFFGLGLD